MEALGDLTMQLGPDEVLLNVDLRFRHQLNVKELESTIDRLKNRIHQAEPSVTRIFLEADSLKPASPSRRVALYLLNRAAKSR